MSRRRHGLRPSEAQFEDVVLTPIEVGAVFLVAVRPPKRGERFISTGGFVETAHRDYGSLMLPVIIGGEVDEVAS